jgi:hypothetical protein
VDVASDEPRALLVGGELAIDDVLRQGANPFEGRLDFLVGMRMIRVVRRGLLNVVLHVGNPSADVREFAPGVVLVLSEFGREFLDPVGLPFDGVLEVRDSLSKAFNVCTIRSVGYWGCHGVAKPRLSTRTNS